MTDQKEILIPRHMFRVAQQSQHGTTSELENIGIVVAYYLPEFSEIYIMGKEETLFFDIQRTVQRDIFL